MKRLLFVLCLALVCFLACAVHEAEAAEQTTSGPAQVEQTVSQSRATVQHQAQSKTTEPSKESSQPSGNHCSYGSLLILFIVTQVVIQAGFLFLVLLCQNSGTFQRFLTKKPEEETQTNTSMEQILEILASMQDQNWLVQEAQKQLSSELKCFKVNIYTKASEVSGVDENNIQTQVPSCQLLLQNPRIQMDIERWKESVGIVSEVRKICITLTLMELIGKNDSLISSLLHYISHPLIACLEADSLSPSECQKELEQWAEILNQHFDAYEIRVPRINASVDSSWMNNPNKVIKVSRIASWGIRNQNQIVEHNATVK